MRDRLATRSSSADCHCWAPQPGPRRDGQPHVESQTAAHRDRRRDEPPPGGAQPGLRSPRVVAISALVPAGLPIRDAAHSLRLREFLALVRPPLTYRVEVPLPVMDDRPELRAWDAMLFGLGRRTAIELEMRLRDVQALLRRIDLRAGRPDGGIPAPGRRHAPQPTRAGRVRGAVRGSPADATEHHPEGAPRWREHPTTGSVLV